MDCYKWQFARQQPIFIIRIRTAEQPRFLRHTFPIHFRTRQQQFVSQYNLCEWHQQESRKHLHASVSQINCHQRVVSSLILPQCRAFILIMCANLRERENQIVKLYWQRRVRKKSCWWHFTHLNFFWMFAADGCLSCIVWWFCCEISIFYVWIRRNYHSLLCES
jgi:hypothetical protein